jgi:hypothetical protein
MGTDVVVAGAAPSELVAVRAHFERVEQASAVFARIAS